LLENMMLIVIVCWRCFNMVD